MKIKYSVLLLIVSFLYGMLKQFFPNFPLDDSTFLALVVFIIGLFGLEVEEGLRARGLLDTDK
jgi:hypothetical protein